MWLVGTLWSNSKWTHQITKQVFCEWTLWVLSQFWSKCPHNVSEPLIESSFKIYLAIWSQCTQSYTQWVLWEFVVKLNHIESLLWVLWKEPTGHIFEYSLKEISISGSDTLWVHFEQNYERTQRVHSQNTSWVIWWVHFEFDHNAPTNHIEIKVVSKF